jgi:signal recognition particle receptor subunit beta
MVLFNYSTKELTAKIVYYGPGLCGKTTNLQYIHENLPGDVRGKMLSLATKTDRTLFFDFLPIDLGNIRGMKTRVQLYTVPGQVFYNETRKLVLKGADGIVFVADSQETMAGANVESFRNLEENLKAHGMKLGDMPHVLQFNKRDLPKLSGIEELNSSLNKYNAPFYESVATTGIGVQDTLKAVVKLVLLHLTRKYDPSAAPRPEAPASVPVPATPEVPVAAAPPESPFPGVEAPTPASLPTTAPENPAAAAATQAIPLSTFAVPEGGVDAPPPSAMPESIAEHQGPPPPPDFRGTGPELDEPAPEFAEREIDELVDEVEEVEDVGGGPSFGETAVMDPPLAASAPHFESTPALDDPSPSEEVFGDEIGTTFGDDPLAQEPSLPPGALAGDLGEGGSADDEAPIGEPEPSAETMASPMEGRDEADGSLEVDREFDPEWAVEGSEQTGPAEGPPSGIREPDEVATPPLEAEAPADVDLGGELSGPDGPADSVVLTEVASDRDLFEDPDVEVARLDSIEDREIIVPVEVGEGTERRRFKLSIRLHLDPVD